MDSVLDLSVYPIEQRDRDPFDRTVYFHVNRRECLKRSRDSETLPRVLFTSYLPVTHFVPEISSSISTNNISTFPRVSDLKVITDALRILRVSCTRLDDTIAYTRLLRCQLAVHESVGPR